MKSKCECGRDLHPARLYPLYCACGKKYLTGELLPQSRKGCYHFGPVIGVADCDCKAKPSVYACDLHGICMPNMSVAAALARLNDGTRATVKHQCSKCGDYTTGIHASYRESIRIVTSFSPKRTCRQLDCLATWRRLGMEVVAVQPVVEIEAMAAIYKGVRWVACDGQRPTIAELAAVAADGPALLINSDIAIESTTPEFRRDWLAIEDRTLRVGCRWEVKPDGSQYLQRWGVDAFLITPAMLADFRDIGFRIGKPAWDYWFVIHYSSLGYRIRAKIDRGLMHNSHPPDWTETEGRDGLAIIHREYGINRNSQNRLISELTGRR